MNEFDDPFSLHPHSKPTGNFDDTGREIRLVGVPILADNPAIKTLVIPEKFREHTMVVNQYFYTLPLDVLENVQVFVGEERFDSDLLALEYELSHICGDHTSQAGFWKNTAISYAELRTKKAPPISKELALAAGMKPAEVDLAIRTYNDRDLDSIERFSKGYCGWILTNKQFLDEHDAILTAHAEAIRGWGTHHSASFLPESYRVNLNPGTIPPASGPWAEFESACKPFLTRWRLESLAGPYLPVPIKPLMAGVFPYTAMKQMMDAGGVFFLPDTMPIPSRDQLRGMLDHALHKGEKPEHLKGWLDIVGADNMAKNRMDPYIRMFELQHFWRILHNRHASAIHRRTGKLEEAFGKVFNVGTQQIKSDLANIRKQLGIEWLDRPWPV